MTGFTTYLAQCMFDHVVTCKRFPHYCPFKTGNLRWPVDSPHKEPVIRIFFFSVVSACDVTVISTSFQNAIWGPLRTSTRCGGWVTWSCRWSRWLWWGLLTRTWCVDIENWERTGNMTKWWWWWWWWWYDDGDEDDDDDIMVMMMMMMMMICCNGVWNHTELESWLFVHQRVHVSNKEYIGASC